jgi:CHAT domain-containing protein
MWGCRAAAPAPQTVYDQIVREVNHGDLNGALLEVNRASTRYGTTSPEWDWRFRILKAQVLVSQSAPKEALSILRGDLPASLARTDVAVRKVIYESIAHRYAQEFDQSEEKLTDAERLATAAQPQLLCEVFNAKGALEAAEKKYARAEETLRQALTLSQQQNNSRQEASVLVNLALVAINQGHLDEAIDRSHAALQLSRSLDMQSLVGTNLGNLGWAYFQLGDFENALDFYKEGAERSERSGLPGYTAYWFAQVANTYMALNEREAAENLAKRTLERARSMNNAQTITECLNTLAEITLRTNRLDEAEKYNEEALEWEKKGLDHFGTLESLLLSGRIETRREHFEKAAELFGHIMQDRSAETPLRWEAHARLAELYNAKGLAAEAEKEYRKSIDTIELARGAIERDDLRLSYLSSGIEFYAAYIDFLIDHQRPLDALMVAELSRARTLTEGLSTDTRSVPLSLPTVHRRQLAQRFHATLLFYWLGQKHSYLWVNTPSKTTCFTLPPAIEIDRVVKRYREALLGTRDVLETANVDGNMLYAMLVEPAKKLISEGSRIILLPDGSLYGLNFETLIAPEPKPHYWIEDVTLTTASSLTLLAAANVQSAPKEGNLLLVGNAAQFTPEFPLLRQAEAEIKRVEQYFPVSRREVLTGPQATRTAFLASQPGKFAYMHFVTHGTASRAHPLDSAVILSPEGETSKLYARDIVKHRLNAYLVTVSACNGSGTRAYSGEGLVGLSWAFLRAGAHNVIGALWEVSDASTPQLMDKLYGELVRGQDPASALRAAKLALLHSGSVYQKPFYWAPFQLYTGS